MYFPQYWRINWLDLWWDKSSEKKHSKSEKTQWCSVKGACKAIDKDNVISHASKSLHKIFHLEVKSLALLDVLCCIPLRRNLSWDQSCCEHPRKQILKLCLRWTHNINILEYFCRSRTSIYSFNNRSYKGTFIVFYASSYRGWATAKKETAKYRLI